MAKAKAKSVVPANDQPAKPKREKPPEIVAIICRTQGVGTVLAASISEKLSSDQKNEIVRLSSEKASSQEILNQLRAPEAKESDKPKTDE